jgi:uncharacterized protein YbjT (DUF2867 family)
MFGYFESKGAAERVVAESGLPWTTLRATQFYDLILVVARQLAKLPVIPVAAGFASSPSTPVTSPPGSPSLRSTDQPASSLTWLGPGRTTWPT